MNRQDAMALARQYAQRKIDKDGMPMVVAVTAAAMVYGLGHTATIRLRDEFEGRI